jgi:hypothetical protein
MTIMLAAAILLAVAGQASATALETSGEFRARGWYLNNYFASGKSTEFWDQRLRLFLTWPVAENVKIQTRVDVLKGFWGDNLPPNPVIVNDPAKGPVLVYPAGVPGKTNVNFDWANLQFTWPGTPLTFTIGRQDSTWGTGLWTSQNNRDRIKLVAKFDPVSLVFGYDKRAEVEVPYAPVGGVNDARDFFVLATGTFGGFKMGGGALYYEDQRHTVGPADRKFWDGEFFIDGKAGIVGLKGEVVYRSGKSGLVVNGKEQDLTGLGAYGGGFLTLGPGTLGIEGVYVSGDKAGTPDKNEGGFKSDYNGPFWSVIFYQNMDYPGYGGGAQTSNYDTDVQVQNAYAGKLSYTMTPMKGLTMIVNGLIAQADQVAVGSKNMGDEVDLVLVYGVTDNVSVTAGVGYAFLGDYWKGKGLNLADPLKKPKDPLGSVIAFTCKF